MTQQYKPATPNDEEWTPEKQRCYALLLEFAGGEHHLGKLAHLGYGLRMTTQMDLATFDSGYLTWLVTLSHKHLCRVLIGPAGPRRLAIHVWARKAEGRLAERHPSLHDLIEQCMRHLVDIDKPTDTEGGA